MSAINSNPNPKEEQARSNKIIDEIIAIFAREGLCYDEAYFILQMAERKARSSAKL